jgi:hypothetical protein
MDVSGSRCVVVGGGGVASRKARGLLESGARVVVVSPEVEPEIEAMDVTVERRPYRPWRPRGGRACLRRDGPPGGERRGGAGSEGERHTGERRGQARRGGFRAPFGLAAGWVAGGGLDGRGLADAGAQDPDAMEPSFAAEWSGIVERFRAAREGWRDVDPATEEEVVRCLSRLRG